MNQPNRTSLPVLAFTMGDPGGIGPEVTLRAIDYFSSASAIIFLTCSLGNLLIK